MRTPVQITTEDIAYRHDDATLTGVLVKDAVRRDRRPGVLVVHGGAGLDAHARGRAERIAALGYVVFACDLYGASLGGGREEIMRRIGEFRSNRDFLRARVGAGLDVLRSRPEIDGRVAAVGYCFGGMTVLELARAGVALDAVVSMHGSLDTRHPAGPGTVAARILVCHGALDPHVPMAQVTGFVDEMNQAGADYQVIVYAGAMHGFTHDKGGVVAPGVAYHAPTDARSSRALQTFLEDVFSGVPSDRGSSSDPRP
jgi:dienelactone hydrolase